MMNEEVDLSGVEDNQKRLNCAKVSRTRPAMVFACVNSDPTLPCRNYQDRDGRVRVRSIADSDR